MKIDAIKGVVSIPLNDLEFIQHSLLAALANARLIAGKSLRPYENDGPLEDFDFLCIRVIEAGQKIGLDFSIDNALKHKELDLTKYK